MLGMSKRRREQARPVAAPRVQAGPAAPSRSRRLRSFTTPYLAAILSALLLALAFPPVDFSWIAYVALVPLLVMARHVRSPRQAFRAAWVGGVFYFGWNARWLLSTGIAYGEYPEFFSWQMLLFCVLNAYLGLYWALFAWSFRRIGDAVRVPATVLAPVLWVALEFVRGWAFSGLPWLYIGHTQFANLTLIQTADLVGAYGASFLIAMTGGLITDLLTRPLFVPRAKATPETRRAGSRRFSPLLGGMIILTLAAWAATVGYGAYRLSQIARIPGPAVGAVQTCVPQLVKQEVRHGAKDLAQEMMEDQVLRTRQVVGEARQGGMPLDLVVWPETMVPGILNQEFLEDDLAKKIDQERLLELFRYFQEQSRGYWLQIAMLSREIGAPILYGANASDVEGVERLPGGRFMTRGPRWNMALLMTPDLKPYAAAHTYAKVHLVPFGEFVPFKQSWPWLRGQIMALSPYDFDWTVEPGDPGQTPFTIPYRGEDVWRAPAGGPATARFQVAICYEDSMAYRIRDMARPAARGQPKSIDFLVNISNDGWFNGSVELDQHLNLCAFRAIENRLPIVRSVNTGISAIIQSDGRIERPVTDAAGNRHFVAGQTFGRLLLDPRVTVYTGIGDVFANACLAASVLGLAWAIVRDRRARGGVPR